MSCPLFEEVARLALSLEVLALDLSLREKMERNGMEKLESTVDVDYCVDSSSCDSQD